MGWLTFFSRWPQSSSEATDYPKLVHQSLFRETGDVRLMRDGDVVGFDSINFATVEKKENFHMQLVDSKKILKLGTGLG